MEKVPPAPPSKTFTQKEKKDNSRDADRRIERAIKMIYVGDDVPKTKAFCILPYQKCRRAKKP